MEVLPHVSISIVSSKTTRRLACYLLTMGSWVGVRFARVESSQIFPDPHQNPPQHVLAAAVAPVAPVEVVLRVLDDRRVARAQEGLTQVGVLGELGQDRLVHDPVLDRLPVLSERSL